MDKGGVIKMGANLFIDIKEIDADINSKYRLSKLPKPVKKYIANSQRNKLRKTIDQMFSPNALSIELIYSFMKLLEEDYPPLGRYRSCLRIKNNIMVYNTHTIDKEKVVALFNMKDYADGKELCYIKYSFIVDGKVMHSYTLDDYKEKILLYNNYIKETINDTPLVDKSRVMQNIVIRTIQEDMKQYLYDMLERSGRID